ncbi:MULTISPECIES: TraR/DksA family transcriptional regulator [Pseudoalteromonas]|uniref:Uncharacterized protein n=2 Tax=Pseudoalteromonas TaxID=53246 RepID=A0A0F4R2D4_9GAMM|nr:MULTISPECIES: TraR/DksA C4-type zinc finger protein [Pseudoalteromonas]KJZ12952.1 hypothetical protein TW77_00945 [Pseudoalteromonas rubra]QTL34684.1 TraR/DksA C4-type zinc finger protein [Pseudoalteromonas viridis]RZM71878.1 hypothetical protein C3B51_22380 [Pseudoalteromonas rubra]
MTADQITSFLKSKQNELSQRIAAIEADFKKGRSANFAEQNTERENDDVLDEIHQEAKQELEMVNNAILRIEQGVYGLCQHCEEQINPQRLNALPYTTTCIKCAK